MPAPAALAVLRLDLVAGAATTFTADPVRALHAALHRLIESYDRDLARHVHDDPVKPLTLSPLSVADHASGEAPAKTALSASGREEPGEQPHAPLSCAPGEGLGVRVPKRPGVRVAPGDRLVARAGVLEPATLATLRLALTERLRSGDPLLFEWQPFRLTAVTPLPPPGSPLPPLTTYDQLIATADPASEITLAFTSPTVFRHKGTNLLHPEPRLVFGSHLRRWQVFSPVPLPIPDEAALAAGVFLVDTRLDLTSRDIGRVQQPGFTGLARYRVAGPAPFRAAVAALAAYAFYAGTGARTAFGLGQTERIA